MKKARILLFFILFISHIGLSQSVPKWSIAELKNMVEKYNLQDSITETKNTGLQYMDKAKIEEWAQSWNSAIKERKEVANYFEETAKVRNRADYYKILDAHPLVKNIVIRSEGGIEAYEKYKKETLDVKWRIYRKPNGELSFIAQNDPISKEDDDECFGKRIDTLKD